MEILFRKDKMKKNKNHLYHIVKPIYKIFLTLLYRPTIIGKENIPEEGAVIFASNHKRAFDPLLVLISTKRQVCYLAKSDLFKLVHGWIFRKIGMIPVYRDKQNAGAIIEAEKVLEEGGAIGVFPEGKRNRTKEDLLPFRKGAVRLAKKTKTPIIPCAITGKYRLFRKGIKLEIGKPIQIEHLEIEEANELLQKEIIKMLRK